MPLIVAAARHGGCVIRQEDPPVEEHRNVVYVPNTAETGRAWGIYSRSGRLVPSTGFYRGTEHRLVMQEPVSNLDLTSVSAEAPDTTYLYGGALHPHYGHFLLSTLSRLWLMAREGKPTVKILMSLGDHPDRWFRVPHVAFCFGQLGLTAADFVQFYQPTVIRHLVVPLPSFEEEHFAHSVFAELCHRIGHSDAVRANTSDVPAYLSKAKLTGGVWRIDNESAITDRLAAHGVDIVYPEQLTMREQVDLLTTRSTICGTVGSALHSHIFAETPPRILAYHREMSVVTNFTLIDDVNCANARYYYPADGFVLTDSDPEFSLTCSINNPLGVADDLLRLLERPYRGQNSVQTAASHALKQPSLDQIGLKHGTDKSSSCHNFLTFYERFFSEIQSQPGLRLMEIGVYDGGSVRTWDEYFADATIVGVDIDPRTLVNASGRVTIEIADQSNIVDLTRLATTYGPFDIVIDDGSHRWDHQITSLRTLLPFVKPGGFYVLEDLDTSYGRYVADYGVPGTMSAAKFLHALCDQIVGDAALAPSQDVDAFIRSYAPVTEFVAFYRRTALLRRKAV